MQYCYAVVFFILGVCLTLVQPAAGQFCPQVPPSFPQTVENEIFNMRGAPHTRSADDRQRETYESTYASAAWWNRSEDSCQEVNHGVNLMVNQDGTSDLSVYGNMQNHCDGTWSQYWGFTNDTSKSFVNFKDGDAHIEIRNLVVDVTWGNQSSQQMTRENRTVEVNMKRTSARVGRSRTSSFWSHPGGETYSSGTSGRWVEANADGIIMHDAIIIESGVSSYATIGKFVQTSRRLR